MLNKSKNYKYLILINIFLLSILDFIILKKRSDKRIFSDKWIVMTAFNPPFQSLINLLNILEDWKIVVISNSNKIEKQWKELNNSNKLIFMTLKEQMNLGYHITKYLSFDSYARKSIGYLYAIQHGAKEIFEIDEDIVISDLNSLNVNFSNNKIYYGIRNDSRMINPYIHFGERSIWPRGFRLSDIGYQTQNKFYTMDSRRLLLTPLINQGLINGIPDIDSIFQITKNEIELKFSYNGPLIYFPGYFIPINSKNTKYKYEIFPFLPLATTISKEISDILRGFILQYFAWRYNGCVVYYLSNNYKKRDNISKTSNFIEEKNLFYNLDKYLYVLNSNSNLKMNALEILFKIINDLIKIRFLGEKDLKIYKTYIDDLSNIGYNYSSIFVNKVDYDPKKYINSYTEFNFYKPYKPYNILKINHKNIKIFYHQKSLIKYENILLIINYNFKGFEYLNNYILNMYNNSFPNFVFIVPDGQNTKSQNTIFCKESYRGFFSYICLEKVFLNYPNYKGYLFINDDDFLKVWEIDNFNFNIPWLYNFNNLKKKRAAKWVHCNKCYRIHNILNQNLDWKVNLTKFLGYYDIPTSIADFYYIPNLIFPKLLKILKEMYKSKIFLECAVASAMGIILSKEYQLIHFTGLWGKGRNNVVEFLHKNYSQITIHPIKFSKIKYRNAVNLYNFFMNAEEF